MVYILTFICRASKRYDHQGIWDWSTVLGDHFDFELVENSDSSPADCWIRRRVSYGIFRKTWSATTNQRILLTHLALTSTACTSHSRTFVACEIFRLDSAQHIVHDVFHLADGRLYFTLLWSTVSAGAS